jgi:hypothetical protein
MSEVTLDIKKEFESIREMYVKDAVQTTFNMLLCGEMGSGKSHMCSTGRRPIHVDSFDPGGTKIKPFQDGIKEGWALIDSRWENEDPMNPTVAKEWLREMTRREKMGYFASIGTYVIDSATTWQEALMNMQLKSAGVAGQPPRWSHDYQPVKTQIKNIIRRMTKLPCDVILTGHLEVEKDETSGKILKRFSTIGKGTAIIPTLFDEVYVAIAEDKSDGTERYILTAPSGHYLARTRIGSMRFERKEVPNIRELLKKAGREIIDLPY